MEINSNLFSRYYQNHSWMKPSDDPPVFYVWVGTARIDMDGGDKSIIIYC